MTGDLPSREGDAMGPPVPQIGGPVGGAPSDDPLPPLTADMFLDFVDSSSLLLLPPRKAAEALVAQHRERLSLAKQHKQRGLATCPPPAHKRLRGPRRATTGCTTRLVPQSGGPSAAAPCGNEGTLATLERSLAARNTLHRLRHQVLELPKPNRHGVGLIYGARMSSDDGHDYRQGSSGTQFEISVIYWGELHGATKEEKAVNKRNAQQAVGNAVRAPSFPLVACSQFRSLIRSLAEASPDKCLTVQQLVLDLDVNMSKGWIHFAKLALPGKHDPYSEFLLRRKREAPQTPSTLQQQQ
ncbi:hypothetical protein cyc_03230 [Cyclospora cayetanensis]|uniref:Uncharacterized protein n=1 Tax=Cyclospora cayetanensis TaxID=88456 RepID=A0A1D3CV59_9EIME|nr:hypothetical protein cyc_03230 [Cyclospora cayetanensis]